jgi:hypothetical protein
MWRDFPEKLVQKPDAVPWYTAGLVTVIRMRVDFLVH